MSQHDGQQPVRVFECYQSAGARLIAAEPGHRVEKFRVRQSDGERLPPGLRDAAVEGRRIAKFRPALAPAFPTESSRRCLSFVSFGARGSSNPDSRLRHGAVLDEHHVAVIHRNDFGLALAKTMDARSHSACRLLSCARDRSPAIHDQPTPWASSHVCSGSTSESY